MQVRGEQITMSLVRAHFRTHRMRTRVHCVENFYLIELQARPLYAFSICLAELNMTPALQKFVVYFMEEINVRRIL